MSHFAYIPRALTEVVLRNAETYPVISITGPRQSGKTTFVRHVFPEKDYVSLEDLDFRLSAERDPRGFLERYPNGAILDEVQRVPGLFSYLQTRVDESGAMGEFVLTGSQQFGLMSGITQSLAGRVAMHVLLPFSQSELRGAKRSLESTLYEGAYPPVHARKPEINAWYDNYLQTYLERDVRQIIQVRNLNTFQGFLRLCAGRSGQLLNLSNLGADAGITHTTAREWISVLTASYIIHLLPPHHRNFNKRVIKSPKLHFLDTGLMCALLGIETPDQIHSHPLRGAIFETWVVSEFLKGRLHDGKRSNLAFWRSRSGMEIDLLVDRGDTLDPIEIKSGKTAARDFDRNLRQWMDLAGRAAARPVVVYGGEDSYTEKGVRFCSWKDLGKLPTALPDSPRARQ